MFVDASALTAILAAEDGSRELLARLQKYTRRLTSALSVWETAVTLSRTLDMSVADCRHAVDEFLRLAGVEVTAVPPDAGPVALEAFSRYGKGRHRAALNFGDCFSYASARCAGVPLLYKGDDFALTDIESA